MTKWSLVISAAHGDRKALNDLCRSYWLPLYAYVRSCGLNAQDAEDVVQGFLAQILSRDDLTKVESDRGKFRGWLLTSIRHYLIDTKRRAQTERRGGGIELSSLDWQNALERYDKFAGQGENPESIFNRFWTITILDQVFNDLRHEYEKTGRGLIFDKLSGSLTGDGIEQSYAELGQELGLKESAVKVAVHRLRRRYGQALRDKVAHTVCSPDDVGDELRHLRATLSENLKSHGF